jgi:hypothetical protein
MLWQTVLLSKVFSVKMNILNNFNTKIVLVIKSGIVIKPKLLNTGLK